MFVIGTVITKINSNKQTISLFIILVEMDKSQQKFTSGEDLKAHKRLTIRCDSVQIQVVD